jgi:hypothetical protein
MPSLESDRNGGARWRFAPAELEVLRERLQSVRDRTVRERRELRELEALYDDVVSE